METDRSTDRRTPQLIATVNQPDMHKCKCWRSTQGIQQTHRIRCRPEQQQQQKPKLFCSEHALHQNGGTTQIYSTLLLLRHYLLLSRIILLGILLLHEMPGYEYMQIAAAVGWIQDCTFICHFFFFPCHRQEGAWNQQYLATSWLQQSLTENPARKSFT